MGLTTSERQLFDAMFKDESGDIVRSPKPMLLDSTFGNKPAGRKCTEPTMVMSALYMRAPKCKTVTSIVRNPVEIVFAYKPNRYVGYIRLGTEWLWANITCAADACVDTILDAWNHMITSRVNGKPNLKIFSPAPHFRSRYYTPESQKYFIETWNYLISMENATINDGYIRIVNGYITTYDDSIGIKTITNKSVHELNDESGKTTHTHDEKGTADMSNRKTQSKPEKVPNETDATATPKTAQPDAQSHTVLIVNCEENNRIRPLIAFGDADRAQDLIASLTMLEPNKTYSTLEIPYRD